MIIGAHLQISLHRDPMVPEIVREPIWQAIPYERLNCLDRNVRDHTFRVFRLTAQRSAGAARANCFGLPCAPIGHAMVDHSALFTKDARVFTTGGKWIKISVLRQSPLE